MEEEINMNDIINAAQVSININNDNRYSEAAEYVKKEKELIYEIIMKNEGKEYKAYDNQKSLADILKILNNHVCKSEVNEKTNENKAIGQKDLDRDNNNVKD